MKFTQASTATSVVVDIAVSKNVQAVTVTESVEVALFKSVVRTLVLRATETVPAQLPPQVDTL